jgi:hypothetical protein
LLCVGIVAALTFSFDLWRGPLAGKVGSFAIGVGLALLGICGVWEGLRPAERDTRNVPTSYLSYDRVRFLWLGLGASALCVASYLLDEPPGGPSGGSWLGYTLGTLAFAAMLWLLWFAVRKRDFASRGAPLRAWLSAHVYLGLALLVVMPLHSAFQFGWNLHTAALALAVLAVLTGVAGLGFYSSTPTRMTLNRPGQKLEGLIEQIGELDARCRTAAASLPDALAEAVLHAIEDTRIGGGGLALLRGYRPGATDAAIEQIRETPVAGHAERASRVLEMLTVKRRLLERIALDLRFKAMLDLWLMIHVPVAVASVAAVATHVFVVFYYR